MCPILENYMSHQFELSAVGLKLIKSYEGFRQVPKLLPSGHYIVGYGHILSQDAEGVKLSPTEAEAVLREDLAPIEALVNDHIFAPMTQGQFDGLCSLAFNIGAGAFLKSDVVYALNNGRVIDAANGFDVWRKSEINGETYVIDSLVRRRTAEKILFLRAEQAQLLAGHSLLTPVADEILRQNLDAEDRLHKDSGMVAWPSSVQPAYSAAVDRPEPIVLSKNDIETKDVEEKDIEGEVEQFENWLDELPASAAELKSVPETKTISETLAALIEPERKEPQSKEDAAAVTTLERPVEKSPVLMAAAAVLGTKVLHDMSDNDDDEIIDIEIEMDDETTITTDAIANIVTDDDEILEGEHLITQSESSPITEAADDFRKRLDALMDNPAQVDSADANDEASDASLETRAAPDVAIPTSDLRSDNTDASETYLKVKPDPEHDAALDPVEESFFSTTRNAPAQAAVVKAAQGRQDSAGRFIESVPQTNNAPQSAGRPFIIMMICGLVLIIASVAAFLTGLDLKFGAAGLFASTVGLLFGFLLLLVAFYSWLKTRFTAA